MGGACRYSLRRQHVPSDRRVVAGARTGCQPQFPVWLAHAVGALAARHVDLCCVGAVTIGQLDVHAVTASGIPHLGEGSSGVSVHLVATAHAGQRAARDSSVGVGHALRRTRAHSLRLGARGISCPRGRRTGPRRSSWGCVEVVATSRQLKPCPTFRVRGLTFGLAARSRARSMPRRFAMPYIVSPRRTLTVAMGSPRIRALGWVSEPAARSAHP